MYFVYKWVVFPMTSEFASHKSESANLLLCPAAWKMRDILYHFSYTLSTILFFQQRINLKLVRSLGFEYVWTENG